MHLPALLVKSCFPQNNLKLESFKQQTRFPHECAARERSSYTFILAMLHVLQNLPSLPHTVARLKTAIPLLRH
jgi:hypothetical protein